MDRGSSFRFLDQDKQPVRMNLKKTVRRRSRLKPLQIQASLNLSLELRIRMHKLQPRSSS